MGNKYFVGYEFYINENYSSVSKFCNENNLEIVEIHSPSGLRKFRIEQSVPAPTELTDEELKEISRRNDNFNRFNQMRFELPDKMDLIENILSETDEALCSLYEMMIGGDI